MSDDLDYWGAAESDAETLPEPETRRIGERLYVRPRGWAAGSAALKLPLRLSPDFMRRAMAEGGSVEQVALIVDELTDEPSRAAWLDLDHIDRLVVARGYFAALSELLGMAMGESLR